MFLYTVPYGSLQAQQTLETEGSKATLSWKCLGKLGRGKFMTVLRRRRHEFDAKPFEHLLK